MYLYSATLVKVVDGDTVDVLLDLGFDIHIKQRIRLVGINCPEHGTPEGAAATAFTAAWLAEKASGLTVRTTLDKREKFGRVLGTVIAGARTLNEDLVAAGHAVPYDGGRRLPAQHREAEPACPVP